LAKKSVTWAYFTAPYRDGLFMWFMVATLLTTTLFFQGVTAFPLTLNEANIIGRRYGQLIAINGILITTCQPLVAAATKHIKISQMIIIGFLLNGLGFGILAFATHYYIFALAVVCWTFGEICWIPRSNAALAYLAPVHLRGNYMGVNFIVWGLASVAAPLLGTLVLHHYGKTILWAAGAVVGVLAALIVVAIKRSLDQRCAPTVPPSEETAKQV
jgi:MFS family permease